MIPICLILFILFIAVITFAIKRADSAQAKVTEEFWEKERKANSTLRGDTTDLCYITIPEKFFPLNNDKINDLRDLKIPKIEEMFDNELGLIFDNNIFLIIYKKTVPWTWFPSLFIYSSPYIDHEISATDFALLSYKLI